MEGAWWNICGDLGWVSSTEVSIGDRVTVVKQEASHLPGLCPLLAPPCGFSFCHSYAFDQHPHFRLPSGLSQNSSPLLHFPRPPRTPLLTSVQMHIAGVQQEARDQWGTGRQGFPRIAKQLRGALRDTHWSPVAMAKLQLHACSCGHRDTQNIYPHKEPFAYI